MFLFTAWLQALPKRKWRIRWLSTDSPDNECNNIHHENLKLNFMPTQTDAVCNRHNMCMATACVASKWPKATTHRKYRVLPFFAFDAISSNCLIGCYRNHRRQLIHQQLKRTRGPWASCNPIMMPATDSQWPTNFHSHITICIYPRRFRPLLPGVAGWATFGPSLLI